MRRQVIILHGGESFTTYKEYLAWLKRCRIDIKRGASRGWKAGLAKRLGRNFEVLLPQMPGKMNAKYQEWKIWFEKYLPHMKKDAVLIGHSLGGIFLVKYLSEQNFPIRIRATILVAAPYRAAGFVLPKRMPRFARQGGEIFIYHSTDDPVVPVRDAKKYARMLPAARVRIFQKKGHFNQEAFPEIVRDIRALFKRN